MFVEREAEFLRALDDVVATHRAGEGFVLHSLPDGLRFKRRDPVRPDQRARRDEPRQFVARKQGLGHQSVSWHAGVVGVPQDGAADILGVAALFQDFAALDRVVRRVRIHLVVEVVDQRHHAPLLLILTKLTRVGPHARLNGQGVLPQVLALGALAQQFPGRLTIHHSLLFCIIIRRPS